MKPKSTPSIPHLFRNLGFILILLTLLLIPVNSAFALGVTICGPKEALVSEKADFSVSIACDATIESVEWDFGDLKTGSGISVSHSYKKVGDLTVKVTVTVSYTDKEGKQKTDFGSDTHQITIKAKLKLQADPEVIPVDTGSTTIFAKVVDYRGSTVSSYNKKITLSSFNLSALKAKDISVENGTGSSTATAGEEPDTVTVTGKANSRYVDEASVEVLVVELKIVKVNASTPSSTVVNCEVIPSTVTLESVRFTAPGATKTKQNVSGNFSFTFNQNMVSSKGTYKIKLLGRIGNSTVAADCNINVTQKGTKKVSDGLGGVFWERGMGLTRTTFRDYFVWYTEVKYSVPYSGKTLLLTGGVVHLDYSHFPQGETPDYSHVHKYIQGKREFCKKGMTTSTPTHPVLKPARTISQYTQDYEWVLPEDLKGRAKCTGYIIGTSSGSIAAMPIINADTEVKIK